MEPMQRGGLSGRTVGGFVLESLLGAGGMAEVYRGIDLTLGREVAVKVLPPPLAQFPLYVTRFRAEARAVANLQSPHIVPIFQFGEDGGLLYIVMPILAESLRAKLQREGLPPVETAVVLVTQVAEALDTAHAAGIVHRDVKPENILLDTHNRPLLSDFGIARDLSGLPAADAGADSGGGGAIVTTTGPQLGTPQYMAPEQLRQQPADQRADVYALGVVLYELLAGRLPHEAPSPFEVVASVLTQPVEPPSRHNPALGPALDVAVLTALASDPAARFQSARDFARSLRAALEEDRQSRDVAPLLSLSQAVAPPPPGPVALVAPPRAVVSLTAATVPVRPAARTGQTSRRRRVGRVLGLVGLAAMLVVLLVLAGTLALSGGVGAPGIVMFPLPGFAASRSSPTAPGAPGGAGAPGTSATPSTTAGGTPSPAPTGSTSPSPVPDATPTPTGPLAISPTIWQLGVDSSSSGRCTSVPANTGNTTVAQTIINKGGSTVTWQWQSADPALPSNIQYQLNGGLWSGMGAMPSDLLLGSGHTDTLNVRLACGGTYTVTLVAHGVLGGPMSTYTFTLQTAIAR